jgi:3-isopropylmalate/(R)-2-methylmalate dehydratase small subunit
MPVVTADHGAVVSLQEWLEENPDGQVTVDVEDGAVCYDERTVEGQIDDAMREALLGGVWDTTALMYSNRSKVEQTVADLPYVDSR